MLGDASTRASFITTSDADFINTTLSKMASDLEETSIQKREYQSLISRISLSLRFLS